jgi:hypothetical protein
MRNLRLILKAIAAVAVLGAVAWTGAAPVALAQAPAAQQKKVKDQGEYEIYNEAIKDASNPSKEIQDLDAWTQKYPDSDYKDDRLYMYMQAYSKMTPPQSQKVIDYGQQLINKGLNTVFPGQGGGLNILNVLFLVSWNVASLPNPTPEQLALGEKAARQLLDFAPKYFVAENKPAGTTDQAWAAARADIEKRTKTALGAMAVAPGNAAMAKDDCAAAESAYAKALGDYPDNASISYNLGRALNCLARKQPDKATDFGPRAIYEFVRAAVVDPTLGGSADPKKISDYANSIYTTYHGSDEGLDQLKQQVKSSPLPPAGFSVETSAAVSNRKQKEFADKNPQLALWMGIKGQLADTNGQQYFEGQLKDADVAGQNGARALKGTIVEGKPACRSKELLISIPDPTRQGGTSRAEITLKLDVPLTGKPAPGETIEFDGVPRAFTKDPFMLTMETDKSKITGLKVESCGAARPGTKKGTTKKK